MKGTITDLLLEEEESSSCTIYMNDRLVATVDAEFTTKLGLRIGLEIEEVVIRKLIAADEVVRARNYALELLLDQIYTKQQMIDALEKSGFCSHAVAKTLKNLEQLGKIRDEKYAKNWVKNRRSTRPTTRTIMRRELTGNGVDRSTADRVLAEINDADETALALKLAVKQASRYRMLSPHVAKRRLYAFLSRRGFDHETIGQVMRQIFSEGVEQSREIQA